MKHPYPMSDSGGLPTPLTGIETPRVDVEERGAQRHKPVYGMGLPFSNLLKMPSSPPKKSSEPQPSNSPLDPVSVPPSIPKESSSSEHSSSDSSAEESDDENVKNDTENAVFGLGSMLQPIKTSPSLPASERSVKPTPSPRYPTQVKQHLVITDCRLNLF